MNKLKLNLTSLHNPQIRKLKWMTFIKWIKGLKKMDQIVKMIWINHETRNTSRQAKVIKLNLMQRSPQMRKLWLVWLDLSKAHIIKLMKVRTNSRTDIINIWWFNQLLLKTAHLYSMKSKRKLLRLRHNLIRINHALRIFRE